VSLSWTPIPHVASAIEGVWYLSQEGEEFDRNFNLNLETVNFSPVLNRPPAVDSTHVCDCGCIAPVDCLRQDGLISEYEFEQKRRHLDRIV